MAAANPPRLGERKGSAGKKDTPQSQRLSGQQVALTRLWIFSAAPPPFLARLLPHKRPTGTRPPFPSSYRVSPSTGGRLLSWIPFASTGLRSSPLSLSSSELPLLQPLCRRVCTAARFLCLLPAAPKADRVSGFTQQLAASVKSEPRDPGAKGGTESLRDQPPAWPSWTPRREPVGGFALHQPP